MENYLKRTMTFFLALLMLLSVPLQAFAQVKVDHKNIAGDKAKFVNKLTPVQIAKPDEGKTAEDLIKNPDQPAIYTLRTDYKVQRGEKYEVNYQPYIASVGAAATPDEQKKVNKIIKLPALAGYDEPQDDFTIDYDTVKNAADGKNKTGNDTDGLRYTDEQDFKYTAKSNQIKIKHVAQDLEDFTKYTNPDGTDDDENALYTTQNGNTGSTMEVSPLGEGHPNREGFVPEVPHITMQVPENAENFVLEYRYNRAHYDVVFDTQGGTPLPARTLYYGQVMPKIADTDIPTKVGGEFQGWKPSVDLKTKDGKKFKANEIIKDGTDAIKNLDANLLMPASKVTFTAVWKDKEKANYAVQFWAEKADHADGASMADKYDYIGTRVYKDQDTGMIPDLDNEPVKDIVFPDLDQARLAKVWKGDRFNRGNDLYLNKFYVYNQNLTHEQNADPKNTNVIKSVDSTGKTVYNIYYDRQVYELYFTKSNALPAENTFYPEIWGYDEDQGEIVKKGGPGNPYHYKARFNQLMLGWPNDAMQTKGFDKDKQSFGWGPNYSRPNWPLYLDTPPYRLNADEFLDMKNYDLWGGYTKKIDKGDGTNINLKWSDFTILSFGINQAEKSMPHHMDLWMDGFKPDETIIRYDLYRYKADTSSDTYAPKYPRVQGFTGKRGNETPEFLDSDGIAEKNEERAAVTPFPAKTYTDMYGNEHPVGEMPFIKAFFNNADEFGDPDGWDGFQTNGYLKFEYTRNKYPLRFNYDPSKIKGDSEFDSTNSLDTFYEFPLKALSPDADTEESYNTKNPKNILDNPEKLKELGLTDLVFNDPNDNNKLKVKRPENLSDQMVFKGWALDPAGTKLIWENPGEIMPNHPVNLFAKWGEPDYKWKVTFDPDGGNLRNIKEEDLTTSRKNIQEGDIGQEEINTYAKKEANEGDKQIFTVIQRQKLVDPKIKPTKKGYDFMGWEVIRYKKNEKGDYTDEIDDSYRKTYKVPELYSFGNDVVAPVYLKAIWVPNDRVDVKVEHHILSSDLKEETKMITETLSGKRANYLVATTGDKQDDKYILVTHEELEEKLTGDLKKLYEEYNERVKANNTFFQQFRVEPEKKLNPATNKLEDNPDVKNNIFHFFYKPFRTRQYKVNYIDERFKDDPEKGKIIDQELVSNGNRHYDARNYRPIPGWKLVSAPQQQLFFDVNEKTNEFLGINGTGKDEITFYYKDVRVIEVPNKDDPVPDGYVRVTFKADKGGSFKDKDGKEVTELYYDVIKGLKSDLLPVPKELAEGETADKDKHYITPETGKKFVKWDEKPLLNKNTIVDNDAKDFYIFTAKFDWQEIKINPLVITEAFIDPNDKWTNDFAPTIDKLKGQVKWYKNKIEEDLPAGTTVSIVIPETQIYEQFKEHNRPDKDELVRDVEIPAIVKFSNNSAKSIKIPVKVYKNVYEALTGTEKPLFLSEAEKGELKDVTGDYVKVTVAPTGDLKSKDNKVYYVNPKAWVEIPEVKLTDEEKANLGFTNWTADKDAQNENQEASGVYDFAKRHKFTEDTVISPGFSKDVVPQVGEDKPKVPDSYVKVIVDLTDKAKIEGEEKQTQTFWVNPTKEVTLPVTSPSGKEKQKVTIEGLGEKEVNYIFKEWQKVKTGEADDKLMEVNPVVKIDLASHKYTDKVTVIEAAYKKSIQAEPIVKPLKTTKLDTPKGKEITNDDLIKQITPQEGKEIDSIEVISKPDGNTVGNEPAKVIVKYKDGTTQGTNDNPVVIPVEVHDNIIPAGPNGEKPEKALDNYVKVIFKAGTGGTVSGDLVYYVSPEVEVDMTESAGKVTKTPSIGYFVNGEKWTNKDNKALKGTFTDPEIEFVFNFEKSTDIVEKTSDDVKKPDGFVTVIFKADENGNLEGNVTEKIYYVNPKAGIKLVELSGEQKAEANQLAVPTTIPNKDYGFAYWSESLDLTNTITGDREYVAHFTKGQVTLTYVAGGAEGNVPDPESTNIGGRINLSSPSGLSNGNKNFIGWMVDGSLYQAGSQLTLTKDKTAVAKWTEDIYPADENGNKTEETPENYVKVTLVPTEKAIDSANKIYYVNPDKYLTIPAEDPKVNNEYQEKGYSFSHWDPSLSGKFVDGTVITAKYKISSSQIIPLEPDAGIVETRVGIQPNEKDYKDKITPPKGKTIKGVEIIEKPDVSKEGVSSAKVNVIYTDGSSSSVDVTVVVYGKIPEKPDKPDYPYYPEYPGGPIPMYPEVRYETIIQEKIVKVPVPVSDNYFKEVRYMQGFNGYFRPNDGLTRAEAAQILANALVEDGYKYNPNFKISYKDIGEAWYTRAVKIVTEANVFAGYDDGNFKPQAKITRNEWIATLKRFQELGDASGNNMNLSDNHWAKGEIQAAFNEGWLKIYTDGLATYKGDEFIPRQEVAAVSNKAFKRIVDKTYIGKNNLSLVTYKDVNTSMWAYEDILCASNTFLDRKDRYIAHWVKEDKNQFNIDTSDLKIVQKNFQRNPR